MHEKYDFIVLGAGSGGIAAANRAAEYGARVALIEHNDLGGTCVNKGCVPKKIMWMASQRHSQIENASALGFQKLTPSFDWANLVTLREAYIQRLHGLYAKKLENNQVNLLKGQAAFQSPNTVRVGDKIVQGQHILIATGGRPRQPNIPGAEWGIDSDGFFALDKMPQRVALVGGGYIALELAGMFCALGANTHLFFRNASFLRGFDHDLSQTLADLYQKQGMTLYPEHNASALDKTPAGLMLHCGQQPPHGPFDQVVWAIGRDPNVENLGLTQANVSVDKSQHIIVDAYQNTSQENIYAIGDVTGNIALTPVAIKAGRALAERLFNNKPDEKVDYQNIPTVIYTHPPIATVGLSEHAAMNTFGTNAIQVFKTQFMPMLSSFSNEQTPCLMKLIVHKDSDQVLGCHMVGDYVDEILQGFAVAIKMGATKKDFDNTMAIHPTVAEELVTLR